MTLTDAGVILQQEGGTELKSWEDNNTGTVRAVASEWYAAGAVSPGYGIVGSSGS